MSRKDSKGLFANVLGQLGEGGGNIPGAQPKPTTSPHLMKVAAGVRQIQERGELAEKLLKDGNSVVELDPDTIAPSAIADRFDGAYSEASISELIESMRERGQIVPGLVRPIGEDGQKFQIVYGRRRLAAAKALGVKFRAVIRPLSDEEAVILQGEENTARNDLSFIEKCTFARTLEQAGYSRQTIIASLSTTKSHVSEMITIVSRLPEKLVQAIGPAPEIGRRRWLQLVDKVRQFPDSVSMVIEVLETVHATTTTDERFELAVKSLYAKITRAEPRAPGPREVVSMGFKIADVTYGDSGGRMVFTKSVPREFVAYIAEHLEELHEGFLKSSGKSLNKKPK
jgi:ParB family chromosome partitioning protein